MTKKFYKYAAWSVFGFCAVSVLFSLLFFLCEEYTDAGNSLLVILYYFKLVFDLAATFVGFGTMIYAATKFGWLHGVACGGLYFASVLVLFIYQTITLTISSKDISYSDALSTDNIIDLLTFNAFYSLGQLFITFMVPAIILAFMCYRMIKKDSSPFTKIVSFKNPVQKTMAVFCIIMTAINIVSFLVTNVLAYLIQEEFYITRSDFWTIIGQSAYMIFETSLIYIIVQYIVFLLVFKMYDYFMNNGKNTVKK